MRYKILVVNCVLKKLTVDSIQYQYLFVFVRTALTELSVLGDIISIANQKKYLLLDKVAAEPSDIKPGAVLVYKKKVLLQNDFGVSVWIYLYSIIN